MTVLMQTRHLRRPGVYEGLRLLYSQGGMGALFVGNTANVVKVAPSAARMSVEVCGNGGAWHSSRNIEMEKVISTHSDETPIGTSLKKMAPSVCTNVPSVSKPWK